MNKKKLFIIILLILASILMIQLFNDGDLNSNSSFKIDNYSILLEGYQLSESTFNTDPFRDGLAVGAAFSLAITLFFFYLAHSSKVTLLLHTASLYL